MHTYIAGCTTKVTVREPARGFFMTGSSIEVPPPHCMRFETSLCRLKLEGDSSTEVGRSATSGEMQYGVEEYGVEGYGLSVRVRVCNPCPPAIKRGLRVSDSPEACRRNTQPFFMSRKQCSAINRTGQRAQSTCWFLPASSSSACSLRPA